MLTVNTRREHSGAFRRPLLTALAALLAVVAEPLLQAVVGAVRKFSSGGEQQDDITAVIARCVE